MHIPNNPIPNPWEESPKLEAHQRLSLSMWPHSLVSTGWTALKSSSLPSLRWLQRLTPWPLMHLLTSAPSLKNTMTFWMFSIRNKPTDSIPPHRLYNLKIELEDGQSLLIGLVYSISQTKLQLLHEFLNKHQAMEFIWPSLSSHGTPVLYTWKKDGSLHLCTDFQILDKIMKKDLYLPQCVSNLLDSLWKASVYTKTDLKHAYHLIWIHEGDEWKTPFHTCYGSFKWCVILFGLTNALAAFQCFMNNIFSSMLEICVLIYSDNIEQHHEHVCVMNYLLLLLLVLFYFIPPYSGTPYGQFM